MQGSKFFKIIWFFWPCTVLYKYVQSLLPKQFEYLRLYCLIQDAPCSGYSHTIDTLLGWTSVSLTFWISLGFSLWVSNIFFTVVVALFVSPTVRFISYFWHDFSPFSFVSLVLTRSWSVFKVLGSDTKGLIGFNSSVWDFRHISFVVFQLINTPVSVGLTLVILGSGAEK